MNTTEKLVEYIQEKSRPLLPESVKKQAKICLLDYLGVTCAGACETQKSLISYLSHSNSKGFVRLIGMDISADVLTSAFVNGFNAHVMELDDGHRYGMIHLAAPIISAVLAVAQSKRSTGEEILKGIVIGYEAAVRLAVSIQPMHKKRGFHTAGTCGTIGAAVGAAVILKLNAYQLKTTISAAATSAAGLLEIQEEASELKPYNTGHAAMSGVNAAYIGLSGFRSPNDILGGERGMTKVLADNADLDKMTELCEGYEIERIYLKPYAACRHCHSAIEAAISLKNSTRILPDEIRSMEVNTYKLAVKGHDHVYIQGIASAKLSIPYSVAAAYILNTCGPNAFSKENVERKEILELAKKVHINEIPEFSALSPKKRIAEVKLTSYKGHTYTCRIDYAKGDPENPMSWEEVERKYYDLMQISNRTENADKILEIINHIETMACDLYKAL